MRYDTCRLKIAVKEEYDKLASGMSTDDVLTRVENLRPIIDPLIKIAGICDGNKVLNIGTGAGALPIAIRQKGIRCKIVGIDLSTEMIKLARRVAKYADIENVEYLVMNVEGLEFSHDSFDVIVSQAAINLVSDKEKSLQEMVRVLKHGGILAFSDCFLSESVKCTPKLWSKCVSGALHLDEMVQLMKQCHLQITDSIELSETVRNLIRDGKWNWKEYLRHKLKYWVLGGIKI